MIKKTGIDQKENSIMIRGSNSVKNSTRMRKGMQRDMILTIHNAFFNMFNSLAVVSRDRRFL
jgi:hypothetical protein